MTLFDELVTTGVGLLSGSHLRGLQAEPPYWSDSRHYLSMAINAKVNELRQRGLRVAPANGPIGGLWEVSGHPELTTAQLLNL